MVLALSSREVVSSCGTELQAAQGSAGAEKFASELTHVIVGTWLLSLATEIAPWGCWWRGFPQHAWSSRLESRRQCYNLILEAVFHPPCCIPDLGPLQFWWTSWQSNSDPVLILMGECLAAVHDTQESSGIQESSPFYPSLLPEAMPALQSLNLVECKGPPSQPATYPNPTQEVKGRPGLHNLGKWWSTLSLS